MNVSPEQLFRILGEEYAHRRVLQEEVQRLEALTMSLLHKADEDAEAGGER